MKEQIGHRTFTSENEILRTFGELLTIHGGFVVGGYAIELQTKKRDTRYHDDIDFVCPIENHHALFINLKEKIGYNTEIRHYSIGNEFVRVPLQTRRREFIGIHLLSYSQDDESYEFLFGLKIRKPTQLFEHISIHNRQLPVATIDLLTQTKLHALSNPHIFPSDRSKWLHDLKLLQS